MSVTNTPAVLYESRLATTAIASGMPRRRYPLPQDCPIQFDAYAFDQEFEMLLANFPPAPKNTPSNSGAFAGLLDANCILTKLSQPTPTYGGKGKFTASFVKVPASWDDFQTQNITFPGIRDFYGTQTARDPKPLNVTVRLHYDYFVLDPDGILTGAGVLDSGGGAVQRVTSLGSIANILRTPFGFLQSGSMLTTSEVTGLVKSGGITGWYETVPNTGTYQTWIAYGLSHGWTSTVWDGTYANVGTSTIGQWCFENSRLIPLEGNIVARVTPYTLAY